MATATPTVPTVELFNPAELLVDRNIRRDMTGPAYTTLRTSIADLGVLVPIIVVRGDDGDRVRTGHRRVAVCLDLGIPVPGLVTAVDDDETLRILEQWAENEVRAGLTDLDRAGAVDQLALLGMPAGEIVRRTGLPAEKVDTALTVTRSPAGVKAAAKGMSLEAAAAVAEFDDDEDAVRALVDAHNQQRGVLQVAQRLRNERAWAAREAELRAELDAGGMTVVDPPDLSYSGLSRPRWLTELAAKPGGTSRLDPAKHEKSCPGHAAAITGVYGWWTPAGELVDDLPRDERPEGTVWKTMPAARPVCVNPAQYGHGDRYAAVSGAGSRPSAADLPPAEREKAAAERKTVIRNNKGWAAALPVRKAWLEEFARRKTPPKGGLRWAVETVCRGGHQLVDVMSERHYLARQLLGADSTASMFEQAEANRTVAKMTGRGDDPATVALIVVCCAAMEAPLGGPTGNMAWRRVDPGTQSYLRFIARQGYELSDVERLAADLKPGEKP